MLHNVEFGGSIFFHLKHKHDNNDQEQELSLKVSDKKKLSNSSSDVVMIDNITDYMSNARSTSSNSIDCECILQEMPDQTMQTMPPKMRKFHAQKISYFARDALGIDRIDNFCYKDKDLDTGDWWIDQSYFDNSIQYEYDPSPYYIYYGVEI